MDLSKAKVIAYELDEVTYVGIRDSWVSNEYSCYNSQSHYIYQINTNLLTNGERKNIRILEEFPQPTLRGIVKEALVFTFVDITNYVNLGYEKVLTASRLDGSEAWFVGRFVYNSLEELDAEWEVKLDTVVPLYPRVS